MRQKEKKEKDKDAQKKKDAPSSPPFKKEGLGLEITARKLIYHAF